MQRYNDDVTDQFGNAIEDATITVRIAATPPASGAVASLFSDNLGTVVLANPMTTDKSGMYGFYAADGDYDVTVSGISGIAAKTITIHLEDYTKTLTSQLASILANFGASLIGIYDSAANYVSTTVEGALAEIWTKLAAASSTPGAALVGNLGTATGEVATNVSAYLNLSVKGLRKSFGCAADGVTDDTTKINNAITSGKIIEGEYGTYLVTSPLTAISGQFEFHGFGKQQTTFLFSPTANGACFKLSNGISRVTQVSMRGFGIKSTDSTYTKVALDVYDLSVCNFEQIYIYGTNGAGPSAGACWSGGTGSIGIRTHGREATGVKDIEIVADKPIVIAANPNTLASIGEDMDHWNWQNLYLIGNGNYVIAVDDGLGLMETEFEGYQAWVGGTGGFKINDTRVAPTVTSRGLKFKNVRYEQGTDAAGYAFNMTFTQPIQQLGLEKVLMANGNNGITINGFERMVLDEVTGAATSGTSLITAGATASSVLVFRNCIWTPGGAVTLTGLTQITAEAYRSASYAAPSDAVYAGQIVDTRINVEKVTVSAAATTVGLLVTEKATGDALQVLPQAAGSGATVRGVNNAGTDFTPLNFTFSQLNLAYRTGTATSATAGIVNSAGLQMSLRNQDGQGAVVTAANNLTLGSDGNYFQVNGATQINLILNTNWQGGPLVTLKFNSTPTVKHNQTVSGNNKPIILSSAVDFVAAINNTLSLRYDSTDAVWYEAGRKV